MKKTLFLLIISFIFFTIKAQNHEKNIDLNQSIAFLDLLKSYQSLDSLSEFVELVQPGYQSPILDFYVKIEKKPISSPLKKDQNKLVLLVINGIHPGESEGIDASLLWIKDLVNHPEKIAENVTIILVPCYNVDGMLNRKEFTRCGQNGPIEKGFRADGLNLDLNRDFIKMESAYTESLERLIRLWNPDVFVDTHSSNGADYQYVMTLISTQKDKLGGKMAKLVYPAFNQELYSTMREKGFEMSPYVNVFERSPYPAGFEAFVESPKYSTGYTALFHTLGFVAETHMLKPFPIRVEATKKLLESIYGLSSKHCKNILLARKQDCEKFPEDNLFKSNFKVNRNDSTLIDFKGFEYLEKPSALGNYSRKYYDRNQAFTRKIPYFNHCEPKLSVAIPKAYVIPKQYVEVIKRLDINQIPIQVIKKDTTMLLGVYTIAEINFATKPNEGHFVHRNVKVTKTSNSMRVHTGDYLVNVSPFNYQYVMECLEPETEDGFFAWNFFDPILNQKEGFSDYVFEDEAAELLAKFPDLKSQFEKWKKENPEKSSNQGEVLGFIFKHSPYMEAEYLRYPIFRLE